MARIAALLLMSTALLISCAKQEDVIKIGEYGSLTGTTATFGISTKNGIDMAVEKVNQAGGLLGKKVVVIVEDDQGKPEEAATAVKKLINQDKVIAILGEVASSRSKAGAPICQAAKIPMVSPASTNPDVTSIGDYIFRVCFIDPFQGTVMAKFCWNTLKVKTAAILTDVKNDYSVGLAEYFKKTFQQLGGKVVAEESYSEGDIDFKAQLTAIKAKRPETIFIPGYYTEVGLIARQARELGIKLPLTGGDGWDSPKLMEIGGEALENCYFSNHYHPQDPNPVIQNFVKEYQAKYNEVPDAMAVLGYDVAMVLTDAIKRAGTTEPEAIRDQLAVTKDFEGVSGKITIDANRNASKSAVVVKIEGGKLKYVETVFPDQPLEAASTE
ncbi:MAG: ethanolamine utilization protein EutJ [candidate division Zixibacteria bacterium RBG_16_50_21]|nr:MAG: ethanolamine utilization protein EutJ [candidate division Zixibacteria bacterium RBG_16_50_21]